MIPKKKHAIHTLKLPYLTGEQAYLLAQILEQTIKSIWRTHGDDMADFQGRVFHDEPSPQGSATQRDRPENDTDIDF